jgi:hypothetical protein
VQIQLYWLNQTKMILKKLAECASATQCFEPCEMKINVKISRDLAAIGEIRDFVIDDSSELCLARKARIQERRINNSES